ncbi:MAG: putative metal-dependent phosphoesterase TrpH [Glaciecola sp.]|jgi:predicted metal-dependent phosphoesterase TrpH
MPLYDLHTHTILSDGTTTPEENVAAAVALGLEGMAVTDHDTTAPWDRAMAAADGTSLEIIPGVEFSAELEELSVHVLGYWVDGANEPLQREMDRLRNERERRAEQIVEKFVALGVAISMERVREFAGAAPIGRPHIARAVVELGAAPDITAVFDTWLADDGPAYVPKYAIDPVAAVRLLVQAGGAAVLAHPALYGRRDQGIEREVVEAMAAAGMAGIEADHPHHSEVARTRYRAMASDLGLLVTAGSDFHGESKDLLLGQVGTSRDDVERLRAFAR